MKYLAIVLLIITVTACKTEPCDPLQTGCDDGVLVQCDGDEKWFDVIDCEELGLKCEYDTERAAHDCV